MKRAMVGLGLLAIFAGLVGAGGMQLTAAQVPLWPQCGTYNFNGTEGANVNLSGRAGVGVRPDRCVTLHDDFILGDDQTAPAAGATRIFAHPWRWAGAAAAGGTGLLGIATIDGDGTNQGSMRGQIGATFRLWFATDNQILRVRVAQLGTVAGTRRIGMGSAALTTDPTNGIYWRWTQGGVYTAVCRASATESTIASSTNASAGGYNELTIAVSGHLTGTTFAEFFVDGASIGSMNSGTTNCPHNVAQGISAAAGGTASNTGMTIDFLTMILQTADNRI